MRQKNKNGVLQNKIYFRLFGTREYAKLISLVSKITHIIANLLRSARFASLRKNEIDTDQEIVM